MQACSSPIAAYYDQVAPTYDEDRYGNTFGQYLHDQEVSLVQHYLHDWEGANVLNLACGTGRLMEFCSVGVDLSPRMIARARQKFPDKNFALEDALNTRFWAESFQAILCFHLVVHLAREEFAQLLTEAGRIALPGARLIFDAPGSERNRLLRRNGRGWYGANEYTDEEVRKAIGPEWKIVAVHGVATLPIHRLPQNLHARCRKVDRLLSKSPLRRFSAYRIYVLEKL